MDIRALLLIAACAALPLASGAQQTDNKQCAAVDQHGSQSQRNEAAATVEEVVATEEDGFVATAYVVRWHGARVLLVDPLAKSHLSVGDSATFVAMHQDLAGERLLHFSFTGASACASKRKPQQPLDTATSAAMVADSRTGLIEEVLSAEDAGYRYVGYIVQSRGARVAISDFVAQSHNTAGDNVWFLAMRYTLKEARLLEFWVSPAGLNNATQAKQDPATLQSLETGVVDEVLATKVDGYSYTAYVVETLGSRVVIDDLSGSNPQRVGDAISLVARRISNPLRPEQGVLSFEVNTQSEVRAGNTPEASVSVKHGTATVDEALTMQIDGCRFVAYIVKWNGARVAVTNVFGTTHYAVGERITFPISRAESSGERHLRFLLFDFEGAAVHPQKG
jgi:hypothetical protein